MRRNTDQLSKCLSVLYEAVEIALKNYPQMSKSILKGTSHIFLHLSVYCERQTTTAYWKVLRIIRASIHDICRDLFSHFEGEFDCKVTKYSTPIYRYFLSIQSDMQTIIEEKTELSRKAVNASVLFTTNHNKDKRLLNLLEYCRQIISLDKRMGESPRIRLVRLFLPGIILGLIFLILSQIDLSCSKEIQRINQKEYKVQCSEEKVKNSMKIKQGK